MKQETITVSKSSVFGEVKKHSNYLTERSDAERNYEMVRLLDEKKEALEEAWEEGESLVVEACKLYVQSVSRGETLTIKLSIPTSHSDALVGGMEKEATAICIHKMLSTWYGIVLPTEVESQNTLVGLHVEALQSMLDDRQAPRRVKPEWIEESVEDLGEYTVIEEVEE